MTGRETSTPRPLPYPDEGPRTHWEGCYRAPRHHNCAVVMADKFEAEQASLQGTVESLLSHLIAIRDGAFTCADLARCGKGGHDPQCAKAIAARIVPAFLFPAAIPSTEASLSPQTEVRDV